MSGSGGEIRKLQFSRASCVPLAEKLRGHSNPPAKFNVRHFAVAEGTFGRGQTAIFEGFEDGRFRGRDAGVFQDVIRAVGKSICRVNFIIRAFHRHGRRINAGPFTKFPVSI